MDQAVINTGTHGNRSAASNSYTAHTIVRSVLAKKISDYAFERTGVAIESPTTSLVSLGIDSVEWVSLICEMEKWIDCPIPNNILDGLVTITDLTDKLIQLRDHAPAAADTNVQTAVLNGGIQAGYATHINPYLAAKLRQLKIDRSFIRGQGCYLYDRDGVEYLDFTSQFGALPFGHHPKEIWKSLLALHDDGEPIFCQPSLLDSAGELARRLIDIAPRGLQYVTFANSGAEAVEAALKMAWHATGRKRILSTHFGFHGKTLGALSATGKEDYQKHFGLPLPGFDYVTYGDFAAIEDKLRWNGSQYAGFIVEPIQGEGGVMVPPPGYLRACQELCRKHGIVFIVDEVQTGLGRTGDLFACLAEDLQPDILVLAKALGGGMVPIGACLANAKVFQEKFAMKHSSTFAGNALAARAGIATLDLLTRDNSAILKNVSANGEYLRERLNALRERYPWLITEVRGRGHMIGLRLTKQAIWKNNFLGIAAREGEVGQFLASYLLNVERLRLAPTLNRGEVLRIQPPLNATRAQCEQAVAAIERGIEMLASGDTGAFYRGILKRERMLSTPVTISHIPPTDIAKCSTEPHPSASFAFLLHPLDTDSYVDYDASLQSLNAAERTEFANSMDGLLEPVLGSSATIKSAQGHAVKGDFIFLSHTAEQLRSMPQSESLATLRAALKLAKSRGAQLVGLGAYSSVISGGGALLSDCGLPLTSGNSYTAISALDALNECVERTGDNWADLCVAIVGAVGAIGSCVAMLIAEKAGRLVLIGNPQNAPALGRAKLLATAARICEHIQLQASQGQIFASGSFAQAVMSAHQFNAHHNANQNVSQAVEEILERLEREGRLVLSSAAQAVALGDLVICATSAPKDTLGARVFRRGAIVCDISRPRTVSQQTQEKRDDILVIDGGVIALPTQVDIGPYGLEHGSAYACMAETMLLTLERKFEHRSLGQTLTIADVQLLQSLAKKHGFALSHLQSFGRPLSIAHWDRYMHSRGKSVEPVARQPHKPPHQPLSDLAFA